MPNIHSQAPSRDDRATVDAQHPWLGLLPFREENREYFFGRDEEIDEIVDRIQENALTVLFGQSGLGKSSLLGAGVVPQLRDRGFSALVVRLDYGENSLPLLEQTRRALCSLCPPRQDNSIQDTQETLWEMFHKRPAWLGPDVPSPVLVFDQFEEIFTLGRQGTERETEVIEWLRQISDLLQNRPPQELEARFAEDRKLSRDYDFGRCSVRVLLALREDYLSQMEAWKVDLPLITQNRMELLPLRGPQALEAVLGPGSIAENPLVSREVAGEIVRTVAQVSEGTPLGAIRAVPPLLSLMCERLNAARLDSGAAEIDSDTVRLRSKDILQEFYSGAFQSFPELHREAIRQVVEDPPMVTEGGYRNSVVRVDAEAHLTRLGVPEPGAVFDSLIQSRLITAEDRDGLQRLEITHDVLLPLVLRSREERKVRVAREAAESREREARIRAARTRKRMLVGGGIALALVLLFAGLAVWALAQRQFADEQQARASESAKNAQEQAARAEKAGIEANLSASDLLVANGARSIEEGRWGDAVVQLAAAWKKNPQSEEANLLLPVALRQIEGDREVIQAHSAPVTLLSFVPESGQLVSASDDGHILVRDGITKKVLHDFQDHLLAVRHAVFAQPENSEPLMATTGDDRRIYIYELESGNRIYHGLSHQDDVLGLQFSPGGTQLLSWSVDATLVIHSWDTGQAAMEIRASEQGPIRFACWVENGSRILAVHHSGKITLWDTKDGQLLKEDVCALSEAIAEPVTCAVLDQTGEWLAVGTRNQGIKLWDVADHSLSDITLQSDSSAVWDLHFISRPEPMVPGAGTLFLQVVYSNGVTERWQPHSQEQVPHFESGTALDASVLPSASALSGDGAFQALGDSAGGLRITHAPTGQIINSADAHIGGCTSLAFAGDGMSLWTGGADGKIRQWQVQGKRIAADPSGIQCADVHEESELLLTGGNDGVARLWNLRDSKLLGEFRHAEPGTFVTAVKFDTKGKRLLTAGGDKVSLWDITKSDEPLRTITIEAPHWIRDAAFCKSETAVVVAVLTFLEKPDETPVTWSEGDGWRIYDLESGEESIRSITRASDMNEVAAFDVDLSILWRGRSAGGVGEWTKGLQGFNSPDVSSFRIDEAYGYFFGSSEGKLDRYNSIGRRLWSTSAADSRVNHISIDRHGGIVCTIDQIGMLNLFHYESGALHRTITLRGISGVETVLPHDSVLVMGALTDGRVGIWHRDSARALLRFAHHSNQLARLFFLPVSKTCVTAARDGQVCMLDCGWEDGFNTSEEQVIKRVLEALAPSDEIPATYASTPAVVTAFETISIHSETSTQNKSSAVESFRKGRWQDAWEALERQLADTDTPPEARIRMILRERRLGLEQVSQPLPAMIDRLAFGGDRHFALDVEGGVWSWGAEKSPVRLDEVPSDMRAGRLVVSKDGERLALGGSNPDFQLCKAENGSRIFPLAGLKNSTRFGVFSERDDSFYGAGYDGSILGWSLSTGLKSKEFSLYSGVIIRNISDVRIAERSHLLVTTNKRAAIIDLELKTVELIPEPVDEKDELPFAGWAAKITKDGEMVILGGDQPRVYNRKTKELLFELDAGGKQVTNISPMEDSSAVIAGTSDGWLYSFSLSTGERLAKTWMPCGGAVDQLEIVTGKPWLIATSDESGTWLCSSTDLQLLAHLSYDEVAIDGVDPRRWFSLSADGTTVVTSSIDRRTYRWNLEEAAGGASQGSLLQFNPRHLPQVSGGRIVLAQDSGKGIEIRNASDGVLEHVIPINAEQRVDKMHLGKNGKSLLLKLWTKVTNEQGTSEKNEWLLVDLENGLKQTVLHIDTEEGIDEIDELPNGKGWVLSGVSLEKGSWLVGVDSSGASIWMWESGAGTVVVGRAWLPDQSGQNEKLLQVMNDGRSILLDAITGDVISDYPLPRSGITFLVADCSSVSNTIATSSRVGIVQIWDIKTGRDINSIYGLGALPESLDLSKDGKRMLVAGGEGWAEVWDTAAASRLLNLGQDPKRTTVALSPDGDWCLAGTTTGEVDLWHVTRGGYMGRLSYMPEAIDSIVFLTQGRVLLVSRKGHARIISLPVF